MTDKEQGADAPPVFSGLPPVEPLGDIDWTPPFEVEAEPAKDARPPRKRRVRHARKPEPEPEPKKPPTPEEITKISIACAAGLRVGFGMVATARGPHWKLNESEALDLGRLWAEALAPYMGNVAGYLAFVVAGLRTFDIVTQRMATERVASAEAAEVTNTETVPNANAN